jgi:hypothetical protein
MNLIQQQLGRANLSVTRRSRLSPPINRLVLVVHTGRASGGTRRLIVVTAPKISKIVDYIAGMRS